MGEKSKEGTAARAGESAADEGSLLDQTSEAAAGEASLLDQTAGATGGEESLLDQIITKGKLHDKR